jgi:hypothetical protein
MKRFTVIVLLVLLASGVVAQPVPGHKIYGFVEDATGWGIVGARVSVFGNVSGLVWEGVSKTGGEFSSGYMSRIVQGEELRADVCWLGECVNVTKRGLGAKSVFELVVPVVVDRPLHKQGVRNVSVSVAGASGRLGGSSDLVVFLENVGDFRLVGVNVSLEGVPVSWNVSGLGLLDLDSGEGGSVSFRVSVPVEAVVGGYDFSVKVVFERGVVVAPFVFVVEAACLSDVECGVGFVCAGGVCEVNRRCFNGVLDEGEEGVDCGGVCSPCVVTTVPRPALTTLPAITTLPKTTSSVSFLGSCFNGVLDEGELGVDCGGVCPPCVSGRSLWAWAGGLGVLSILFLFLIVVVIFWIWRRKQV